MLFARLLISCITRPRKQHWRCEQARPYSSRHRKSSSSNVIQLPGRTRFPGREADSRRRLLGRAHGPRRREFPISGTPISAMPDLIRAFGYVKKAAARANAELGALDPERAAAIISACDELIAGRLPRAVRGRRDPGRRGHIDQHERQRGDRQHRAGKAGPRKGPLRRRCTPTTTSTPRRAPTTCIPRRCAWPCGPASTACWKRWPSCARASRPRPPNSATCSRSAAPSCRTPCP